MAVIFKFNPFTSNFDLVTSSLTPSQIIGGNPNQFAYFNTSGALDSLPNWNVDILSTPNRYGLRYFANIDPAGVSAYSVTNQIVVATIPTAAAPNDTEVPLQIGFELDPSNTGFGLGTAGTAVRVLDLYASARTSSTNGSVVGANINLNMGDAVITGGSASDVTGVDIFVGSDQGFSTGNVRGLNINSNYVVGSSITGSATMVNTVFNTAGSFNTYLNMYGAYGTFAPTNAFSGGMSMFQASMNIAGDVGNGQTFVDGTQFQTGSNVTGDWTSASLSPNFQAGSVVRSYTGVNVSPQFNEDITDDIRGVGVFFNTPTAGTNITGLDVGISNATSSSGNITGLNINLGTSTDSNPQGVVGISSDSRVSVNATTQMVSGQGFQIGNRIEHAYSVPNGSPVTGTDSLGNNFAGDLIAQDDIAVGGFGIGWNSVGFIASVGVAATKTIDKATVFLPAMSLPDPGFTTGGAITDLAMIREYPPLAQGGTAAITNLYGFKIDSLFGDFAASATNAWGLYLDTSAPNYMGTGALQLGGSTSGLLSIEAAPVTTSHTLVMPAAQGAASTVLTNDGAGNLSWAAGGSSGPTSFTLVNNQTTFADITGFYVDPTLHRSFVASTSTVRQHDDTVVFTDQPDNAFYANLGTAFDSTVSASRELNDNSIVIGGNFIDFNGNTRFYIAKVDQDGVEDTAFYTNLGTSFDSQILCFAQQADDKILVGGTFTDLNGNTRNRLVRLNLDGTEDSTFATNIGTAFNNTVNAIAVQADQKILVVGDFISFNGNSRNYIVRLNTDGTEDTTFYTNLGTGFNSAINDVKVQVDQKILVAGSFTDLNGNTRNRFLRLNSDGTDDTTFNTALGTAFNNTVLSIAIQPDTDILLVGDFTNFNGTGSPGAARLSASGTFDTTFNTNLGTGFNNTTNCVVYQPTINKIVISGTFLTFNSNSRNYLVRLNSDGTEDTAFYTSLGTGFDSFVFTLYVQANDQILIGGSFTSLNGSTKNRFLRYETITVTVNDYVSNDRIVGNYHASTGTWTIQNSVGFGDDTGVTLEMTDLGQMQYKTTNIPTTLIVSQMKFKIEAL